MQVKICGMRDPDNVKAVVGVAPDYMGFIFYEKSKRYVGEAFEAGIPKSLPKTIKKTGVFVNATIEYVVEKIQHYALDAVQLHGEETPLYCEKLKELLGGKVELIKVFSVGATFDFTNVQPYEPHCHYFLFDTKGVEKGGNGVTFNWHILENYPSETPFFLSGGIGIENIERIQQLNFPKLYGIDVNSRFEVAPAMKDIDLIEQAFGTKIKKDKS